MRPEENNKGEDVIYQQNNNKRSPLLEEKSNVEHS